ncbi:MAG: hypothetical protein OHK0053_35570 [Microscillaceae bacterium]
MKSAPPPKISVLLAVRNEAAHILNCLESLQQLDYPDYEVWIGDDASSDETGRIVQEFILTRPQFHYRSIHTQLGQAQGKANVLAHLAQEAGGEIWYFTDADMVLPKHWLDSVHHFENQRVGMLTGLTLIKPVHVFAGVQAFDWALAQAQLRGAAYLGIGLSALGNNMAVRASAYWATGGYAQFPFSITEDFQLFQALRRQGFHFVFDTHPARLAFTQPAPDARAWLQQRLRWMQGAWQLPWGYRLAWAGIALWPLFLLGLALWDLGLALVLGLAKIIGQLWLAGTLLGRVRQKWLLIWALPFECWSWGAHLYAGFHFFQKKPLIWKGRKYPPTPH